jgi:hypothetical protein
MIIQREEPHTKTSNPCEREHSKLSWHTVFLLFPYRKPQRKYERARKKESKPEELKP